MKSRFVAAAAVMMVSHSVWADAGKLPENLGASCYVALNDPTNIKGENINARLPIASVSKLITSYFAVKRKNISYRFQTVLHVTPVEDGKFDIHLQGSRDPYFGAQRLHFMISELNKRGITKVRNLTFDENFKFYWSIDDRTENGNSAGRNYSPDDPLPKAVIAQLRYRANLTDGYAASAAWAAKNGVKLFENPQFKVENIEHVAAADFKGLNATKIFRVYSTPLVNLLKEMNRNSHNHAANQIFEAMEQEQKFSEFIQKDMGLTKESILMRNGSGDSVAPSGGPYNEVSCAAVVKIMMELHKTLKSQNSSLTRVATVIGTNEGNATGLYNGPKTFDTVTAKTGTINPNVTLGGMASTNKGLIFFFFNMKSKGTSKTWRDGRMEIKKMLNQLMTDFDGGIRLKAQSFAFISFDNQSFNEVVVDKKP